MGYVPLFMAVSGQPCVVIGGDANAEDRVRALLAADARVTVISAALTPGLRALGATGAVQVRERALRPDDLPGFALAYCTDPDRALGQRAAAAARAHGVPLNVLDRPELCAFIAPAVVRRGPLQIAVSTSGASPALARIIRQELEEQFGAAYEALLTVLATARRYLRAHEPDAARRAALAQTLARGLRAPLLRGDYGAADAVLQRELGVDLAALGLTPTPAGAKPPVAPEPL